MICEGDRRRRGWRKESVGEKWEGVKEREVWGEGDLGVSSATRIAL